MSNTIEFFQPQCGKLAVGASAANVYLDGQLCDFLVPETITLAANPDFNQAVLKFYLDSRLRGDGTEEINAIIRCGQRIDIKSVYNSDIGVVCPDEMVIFTGSIEQIEIGTASAIIAKDYSAKLKRKTVYGKYIYSDYGETEFIASADTVFNPSGEPNSSEDKILFTGDENNAIAFKCADAIYYLLQNYVPADELVVPTLEELQTLTNNCGIRDVDVTGLNLIDALARCCKQAGVKFKFVPHQNSQAIVFYRPELCREVQLNCQQQGETIDISKTNISQVTRKKNPIVTNRYIVQGDYKLYEATFELVKGWDASLETTTYDTYSSTTNENFNDVRDVYRKWVLNEAGDYTGSPYSRGDAFDFSEIFGNSGYVRKRRRFYPSLTCGSDGSSIGYYLEISYTDGSYWWPYMSSFKILLDQCGIWLSCEQIDTDMWFAILKGLLKFRVTASVIADERINFTAVDGPINSIAEVADKIVTLPRRFKYQRVSPYSIYANGTANEIDDTDSLVEYARGLCSSTDNVSEQLQIKTAILPNVFSPGDRITTGPDSRDLLGVLYDGRNICRVEKVQMDFANQQTIITAVKTRKIK